MVRGRARTSTWHSLRRVEEMKGLTFANWYGKIAAGSYVRCVYLFKRRENIDSKKISLVDGIYKCVLFSDVKKISAAIFTIFM